MFNFLLQFHCITYSAMKAVWGVCRAARPPSLIEFFPHFYLPWNLYGIWCNGYFGPQSDVIHRKQIYVVIFVGPKTLVLGMRDSCPPLPLPPPYLWLTCHADLHFQRIYMFSHHTCASVMRNIQKRGVVGRKKRDRNGRDDECLSFVSSSPSHPLATLPW